MEDVVEVASSGEEVLEHFISRLDPKIGRDHVEQMSMADLILGLGQNGHLVAEPWGHGDPVPLGQTTHELAIGMELHETEHGGAVDIGHVIVDLDDAATIQKRLEVLHRVPASRHRQLQSG